MSPVRVRFAPSPTGSLHIGGARTALFNWLYAKKHGGQFILRIDDTDLERSTEKSYQEILAAMQWLGLNWDEGPILQSSRLEQYRHAAARLLAADAAYLCYCTPEELAERRKAAQESGQAPMYDKRCRTLTPAERARLEAEGRQPALRLAVSDEGATIVNDIIRGEVVFENRTIDDFVIMKSTGTPTYNFASVIDDRDMAISHVIRAEEHLSNTPKQILVFNMLGYDLPRFAHVPMILAPDRSKLSKRHGATSVEEYRDAGYLAEGIINYLALLGWSPEGEEEIMPVERMVSAFSLERVTKNAAIYDINKLTWINGHYLREADVDRITEEVMPFLRAKGLIKGVKPGETGESALAKAPLGEHEVGYIRKVVAAVRERVKTLAEVADAAAYFFTGVGEYEEKGVRKHFSSPAAADVLEKCRQRLAGVDDFSAASLEEVYRALSEELGVGTGQLFHPTRLAVSGRTMGPGLFDILELLGKERVLARLDQAVRFIRAR